MKQFLVLIFILVATVNLFAQNTKGTKDMVILKDGSILYGKILDFEIGGNVELKLISGRVLTFSSNEIKKIELNSNEKEIPKANYTFKNEVFYNNFNLKLISGSSTANSNISVFRFGIGMDYSFGYRYNDFLSIGLGTGIETYGYGLKEVFSPIYFEYIGFLKKSDVCPFVRLHGGYGFVTAAGDNVIDKSGGINYSAGFGIKYPAFESMSYVFDISFNYQKANFVYHTNSWSEQISYRDVIFRRISLKFGILF